jgi:uncharacterized protein (DUF1800 family)
MNRRTFLQPLQQKKAGQDFSKIEQAQSDLSVYTGKWETTEITHLLKRTMFGAKKTDIDFFKTKTMSEAVEILINTPQSAPAPPVNNYSSTVADPDVAVGATWVNAPAGASGTINSNRRNSLHSWWAGLQINQQRSMEEKMVLFWHNHLVVEADGIDPRYLYQYNVVLRKNALGNFKQFIKEITLNTAMLVYLNGNKNTAGAPNENYARELQELFTMGKGPNSQYTEKDVQEAAKVLTGYDIDTQTMLYRFRSTRHDSSTKTFSAFYNNTIINGRTGTDGEAELDDLLNMLFSKEELSLFICRKLYRFFVYYNIDESIETNIIMPLAAIFRNNNYEIKPVLLALFKSNHFFDPLNSGCLIKSPQDFLVGICREFEVVFPDPSTNYVPAYALWRVLNITAKDLGQDLGYPPSVAGWPAYYQVPQYHQLWINSHALPRRNLFSDTMISPGYTRNSKNIIIDTLSFTKQLSNPSDPNAVINDALEILLKIEISQSSKDYLKTNMLLSGQSTDSYWTTAWTNYINNPTNTSYKSIVQTRLQALYKYLMDLSEYQLS